MILWDWGCKQTDKTVHKEGGRENGGELVVRSPARQLGIVLYSLRASTDVGPTDVAT